MSKMKLLMENWSTFLNEDATQITTIGQLHDYFLKKDPGTLKKLAAKYGGITAKIMGIAAGAAAGPAGIAAGVIAEQVVEQMLSASIMAFADIEDGTYPDGSAASYFDLNDHLSLFMRHLETKGREIRKPSQPELEVYAIMKKKVQDAVKGGVPPNTTIQELLQNITSQAVLDRRLATGEHSGKVSLQQVGE